MYFYSISCQYGAFKQCIILFLFHPLSGPKVNPNVIRGVHMQKPRASLTAIYGYTT